MFTLNLLILSSKFDLANLLISSGLYKEGVDEFLLFIGVGILIGNSVINYK